MPDLNQTVGLDISAYKAGAAQLTAEIKNIETGFKASAAIMGDWSNTSNGLRERTQSLAQELDLQKQKLSTLTQAYQKTVSEQGADSKSAQSLASQMFNVEQQIQRTQTNLNKYTSDLKSAEQQEKSNTSSLDKFKSAMQSMANQSQKSTSSIKDHFSGLKSSIAGAVAGIGVSLGVSGLAHSIYSVAESASDLVEAQNVVENTYKTSAKSVEDWTGTMAASAGISKTAATQFVGTMGAMLKSSGVSEQAAGDMSEQLVQLTGDMSSFYNVSTTDMWEKIRSGISGETEPLKQLGINMSVANLSAYALAQGIKKPYDQMTQGEQTTLRYNYLLSVTKDAQGDFARTSNDSMANQSRIFQMNIDSMKQSVGSAFLPMINSMYTSLNPVIQELIPKLASGAKNFANVLADKKDEIIGGIQDVFSTAKNIFGFVEEHGELIKNTVIGITGVVVTWKAAMAAYNAVQTIHNGLMALGLVSTGADAAAKAAETTATGAATAAQIGLNVAMTANPIGLVIAAVVAAVAAIAALTIGIVELVKHFQSSSIETQKFGDNVSKETQSAVEDFNNLNQKADEDLKELAWTGETVTKEMADNIKGNIDQMAQTTIDAFNKQRDDSVKAIQDLATTADGITKGEADSITKNINSGYDQRINSEKAAQKQIDDILSNASSQNRALTEDEVNKISSLKENMYTSGIQSLSKNQVEEQAIFDNMRVNNTAINAQEAADIVKKSKETTDKVVGDANDKYNDTVAAIIRERDETHTISADQADKLIQAAQKTRDDSVSAATDAHDKVVDQAKQQAGELAENVDWTSGTVKSKWQVMWDDIQQTAYDSGREVALKWEDVKSSVTSAWDDVGSWFSGKWDEVQKSAYDSGRSVAEHWRDAKQGISDAFGDIGQWFTDRWNEIKSSLDNLNPAQWGRDLIDGIANGIREAKKHVEEAVGNVADTIKSYLHFSRPDVGPLVDYEQWMPDFASGLANSLKRSSYLVRNAAAAIAREMQIGVNVSGTAGQAVSAANQTTNYNSYGPQSEVTVLSIDGQNIVGAVRSRLSMANKKDTGTVRGSLGYANQ